MLALRTGLLLAVVALASLPATAEAGHRRSREDRPCGPGVLNLLVPQGFLGADFRPACRRHDYSYAGPGSRRVFDSQFERDLLRSCRNSRFPLGCRMTARTMAVGTKLFGGLYRSADAVNRSGRNVSRSLRSW